MKKIVIVLLSILLVFAISGCNTVCGDDCECKVPRADNTLTEVPTVTDVPVTETPTPTEFVLPPMWNQQEKIIEYEVYCNEGEISCEKAITDETEYVFTFLHMAGTVETMPATGIYMCVLNKDNTLTLYGSDFSIRRDALKTVNMRVQDDYLKTTFPFYECFTLSVRLHNEKAEAIRKMVADATDYYKKLYEQHGESVNDQLGINENFDYSCYFQLSNGTTVYTSHYTEHENVINELAEEIWACFWRHIKIKPETVEKSSEFFE